MGYLEQWAIEILMLTRVRYKIGIMKDLEVRSGKKNTDCTKLAIAGDFMSGYPSFATW